MDPRIHDGQIIGLPGGNIVLFLAKTTLCGVPVFCAVFGPADTCTPPPTQMFVELFDAKLAIFDEKGALFSIYAVHHGHKYSYGGGLAEISNDGGGVRWTTADECGSYRFLGQRIPPRDVLIAL